MLKQFVSPCDDNNLLPDYRSAYRKNYSCEAALVKLMDDVLWAMERQLVTAVVAKCSVRHRGPRNPARRTCNQQDIWCDR